MRKILFDPQDCYWISDTSVSYRNLLLSGHPIANVRNRALQSVVFKISNQLVEPSDLAESRIFIKSLLEWFNNDQWECETLVIQLIEIMSNVSNG